MSRRMVTETALGVALGIAIGAWVVAKPDGFFAVWPHQAFVKAWRPEEQT